MTFALHLLFRLFLAALREADEERESGPRALRPSELILRIARSGGSGRGGKSAA